MDIIKLNNADLLESAKRLSREERQIQVQFLWHLLEIQKRRLYLDIGYPSLFDFVTKELGLSESAAYRRIQAMRLLKSVPQVAEKIEAGLLNLTTAAQVQTFIKAEDKGGEKMSYRQKSEVIAAVEAKSSRDVEKHLVSLKPEHAFRPEKVRFITPEIVELKIMIPDSLKIKMDDLRFYFSHINPEMTYLKLIELLTDRALAKIAPKKFGDPAPSKKSAETPTSSPEAQTPPSISQSRTASASSDPPTNSPREMKQAHPRSRHIPSVLRHAVWLRDGGVCSFLDPVTRRKCGARYHVQVDHIKPWGQGGSHGLENLQLLCGEHNRQKGVRVHQKV